MNQRQCALVELERRKDKVPRLKNRPARDRPTTDQRACDSFFSPILGITPKHSGIRSEKLSDLSHTIFGSAPVTKKLSVYLSQQFNCYLKCLTLR